MADFFIYIGALSEVKTNKKWPGKFSINLPWDHVNCHKKIRNKMYYCRRKQMRIWELFIPSEWGPIPLRSKPRTLRGPPKKKLSLLSNHNFLNVVLFKFKINGKFISKVFHSAKLILRMKVRTYRTMYNVQCAIKKIIEIKMYFFRVIMFDDISSTIKSPNYWNTI